MPAMPRWLEHRIPPPLIDLAVAALMWALACLWPLAQLWPRGGRPWGLGAALGLALAGGGLALAGAWEFRRAHTSLNPLAPQRTRTLVTSGVFGLTRNPMYLGMVLVLLGWAVWLGNAAALAGPPLAVWLLTALQIQPEERILRQRFGAHYERYAARVRRWL